MTTDTTTPDAAAIARLSVDHRKMWTGTILALVGTDRQRRAFIDGYNDLLCPPYASAAMRRTHALGLAVRAALTAHDEATR